MIEHLADILVGHEKADRLKKTPPFVRGRHTSTEALVISWKFLIKYYEYYFDYLIIIMNQLQLTLYLAYSTVCSLLDTDLRNLLSS